MAGFCGATQAVLDGSLQLGRPTRLFGATGSGRVAGNKSVFVPVRAQRAPEESEEAATQSSRRAMLRLVAAGVAGGSFVKSALAAAKPIKVGPPPPLSGGLPGTKNSDVPRDVFLPLKERFFIQPLSPVEAVQRVKDSAKEIVGVKSFIEKKAWPYVSNDLRLKSSYLRYDLNTVISSKSKEEKQSLKELTGKLFATIDDLDHAAKTKSPSEAEKYYALTVTQLNDVIAKLG